jgi:hypothetical protein
MWIRIRIRIRIRNTGLAGYQNAAETSKVVYRDSVRPALENFSTNAQQASGMTTFRSLFLVRFSKTSLQKTLTLSLGYFFESFAIGI